MDFWQISTVLAMALAFAISLLEVYQVYLQRHLIAEIRDKLAVIDMDAALDRTERATTSGLETLRNALERHLAPMSDKVQSLDVEALTAAAIDRAMQKLDVAAAAELAADVMVKRAQEALPGLVESAKGQVVDGTPGAEQALGMLDGLEGNPLMSLILMASARPAQPANPGNQPTGRRAI